MDLENSRRICARFPSLFRATQIDFSPWGAAPPTREFTFECGNGWHELIYRLTDALSQYAAAARIDLVATEVKEKRGTLRFYVDGGDHETDRLIDAAERESEMICQVCGQRRTNQDLGRPLGPCPMCDVPIAN